MVLHILILTKNPTWEYLEKSIIFICKKIPIKDKESPVSLVTDHQHCLGKLPKGREVNLYLGRFPFQ